MERDLRTFMCVTENGAEPVQILDVLVMHDNNVYLVCKGKRPKPYVFEIMCNGIRVARPDHAAEILELHEIEVAKAVELADAE